MKGESKMVNVKESKTAFKGLPSKTILQLSDLRVLIELHQAERYSKDYPNQDPPKVTIKHGRVHIKIDLDRSGFLMVEKSTGFIYGIKAYGQIHRGHQYGSLETINDFFFKAYFFLRNLFRLEILIIY